MSDLSKEAVNLLVEWAEYRSDHSVHARTVLALIADRVRLERENAALRAVTGKVVSAYVTHGVEVNGETEALRDALRELQTVTGFIPGDADAWKADDHG